MRTLAFVAAVLVSAGCATAPVEAAPEAVAAPPPEPTFGSFEAPLAAYGQWIVVGHYGRVWRPLHVGVGWQPYYSGQWVWTADGWFWVTDEPWGWATYHYGRWAWEPGFGWVWVPGYVWGPAWVAWREGEGFIGWAPLYPGYDAWWVDAYPLEPVHWIFVPVRSFVGVRVDRVAVPRQRVPPLVHATRPAPPRGATRAAPAPPHGGPPREVVERETGRRVKPVRVVPARTPADARGEKGGTVPVYRPAPAAREQPAREPPPRQPAGAAPAPERAPAPATRPAPAPAPSKPSGAQPDDDDKPKPAPAPAPRR